MKNIFTLSTLFVVCIALAGCSDSDDGGGGGGGGQDLSPATFDITGSWQITANVSTSSPLCASENGVTDTYAANFNVNGNTLTGTVNGVSGNGTVDGSTVTITVSYAQDGGTTTETITGTITDCGSMSGTSSWNWSSSDGSCQGTATWTGVRVGACPGSGGGGNTSTPFTLACRTGLNVPIDEGAGIVNALTVGPGSCDTVYWSYVIEAGSLMLYEEDLLIRLQSPGGTTVTLFDGPGVFGFFGEGSTNAFSGENPEGNWGLIVEDTFVTDPDDDDPHLKSWCLSGTP